MRRAVAAAAAPRLQAAFQRRLLCAESGAPRALPDPLRSAPAVYTATTSRPSTAAASISASSAAAASAALPDSEHEDATTLEVRTTGAAEPSLAASSDDDDFASLASSGTHAQGSASSHVAGGRTAQAFADDEALADHLRTLVSRNAARQAAWSYRGALKRDDPTLVGVQSVSTIMPILARLTWTDTIGHSLEHLSKHGIRVSTGVYNSALNGLMRVGRPAIIEAKIAQMWNMEPASQPNVTSYNHLIGAYFRGGEMDQAYAVLQDMKNRMVYPTFATYHTLISGCIRRTAPRRAFETLLAVEQQRFDMSALTISQVLVACAEADDLPAISQLIPRLENALPGYAVEIDRLSERRNMYRLPNMSWTTVADRAAVRGEPKLEVSGLMSILHAAYRGARPDIAERIMLWFSQWYPDMKPAPSAWYCVIGSYAMSGDFASAFDAVSRMRTAGLKPSLRELNGSLIKPLSADLTKVDEQYFRLLEAINGGSSSSTAGDSGVDEIVAAEAAETASAALTASPANESDTESATVQELAPQALSGTVLIRDVGGDVSDVLSKTETVTPLVRYDVGIEEMNCIIAACSAAGDLDRAFQTYDEAQRCGLERNTDTFNALLSGCISTRHFKGGMRIRDEMEANNVPFNDDTVYLLVRLYVRVGQFDAAMSILEAATNKGVTISVCAFQTLARKLMSLDQLGQVRRVVALGDRNGISSQATLARIEGPCVRYLRALEGTEETLTRSPHTTRKDWSARENNREHEDEAVEVAVSDVSEITEYVSEEAGSSNTVNI
jgi:pentatricopeptide repeat protein